MTPTTTETALFAAGCFWGVEETFRTIPGVIDTEVGYSGGHTENPTYEDVCTGTTGHAETLKIVYNPKEVSFKELIDIFWKNHNPTTKDRQGPDIGSQYRSAVFYTTAEQKEIAEETKDQIDASGKYHDLVVTEISPAKKFYSAEEYHQEYLNKRGLDACHI